MSEVDDAGGSDAGSPINPTNWPDNLRQYRRRSPDEPDARDVQNPHEWDDPDPSAWERAAPDTTLGWLIAWALGIITLAVAAYLVPIFAGWMLDPLVFGGVVVVGVLAATYFKGRADGISAYKDLDKSVVYYGDDVDVRLGYESGDSGPETVFTPLRDFALTGLKVRPLLRRDLPYDAGKLRSNRGEDVGSEEVRDSLNKTTVSADSELGRVFVTHASDLDHAAQSGDVDRYTALPDRFDSDVAEDVQLLIRRLRRQIKALKADTEELERAAADARDSRQKQLAPELEQTLLMINSLQSAIHDDERNGHTNDESAGIEAIREAAEKANNRGGWD